MILEEMQQQRLRAWEEALAHFRRVVDGIGRPIDPGILETVVALNLLSISTTASCEGHPDRPQTHPWIDLGVIDEETRQMTRRSSELRAEAARLSPQNEKEAIDKLMDRADELRRQVRPRHRSIARLALPHLDAFYREHTCDIHCRLIIRSWDYMGKCRIEPQGAFLFDDEQLNEREHTRLLQAFQQEMRAFTAFLKRRYLEKESEE